MKRSYLNVLEVLARTPDRFILGNQLPDGNGRPGGASGTKLSEMKRAGLIVYGKNQTHSHYGWKISEAGLAAWIADYNQKTIDRTEAATR